MSKLTFSEININKACHLAVKYHRSVLRIATTTLKPKFDEYVQEITLLHCLHENKNKH